MEDVMRKLLEDLNQLAAKKNPRQRSRRENILRKIRWWGYSISVVLLIAVAVIGLGFSLSNTQQNVVKILGVFALLLPTLVLLAEIVDGAMLLIQWKKETFDALIKQTDSDIACVNVLSKYSRSELERARQWIKNKIDKDSGRLSLFGTDKISVLATVGLLASGWTVYEKTQTESILQTYQMGIFFVLAFIAGTILGSIFIKVSHQRLRRMEMWLDLAIFDHVHIELAEKNVSLIQASGTQAIRIAK